MNSQTLGIIFAVISAVSLGISNSLYKQSSEEAMRLAKESSCYKIMLLSGADNKNHAFYEKLGFDRNRKVGFEMSFR